MVPIFVEISIFVFKKFSLSFMGYGNGNLLFYSTFTDSVSLL